MLAPSASFPVASMDAARNGTVANPTGSMLDHGCWLTASRPVRSPWTPVNAVPAIVNGTRDLFAAQIRARTAIGHAEAARGYLERAIEAAERKGHAREPRASARPRL